MCGFIITNIKKNINLNSVLKHRGPDDFGSYNDNYIKIIFNRLSIFDLTKKGSQPMRAKNLIIIFNGEIFNFIEIRKSLEIKGYVFKTNSDTEVLLNSYIEWKEECLKKIEGMFAFVIYNIDSKELFIARDAFGIKPLFFYKNDNNFIFASEKKAIFKYNIKKEINERTIANYFAHGVYQHSQETFYKNINIIEPGTFVRITNGKFYFYNWFKIKPEKNTNISYNEAKNKFNFLLNKSIQLCLRSERKISIACSGGVDSSVIALKAKELKKDTIEYLLHWTCDDENDEKDFASEISKITNIRLLTTHFNTTEFYKYLDKCIYSIEEPFGGLMTMVSRKTFENLKKKKIPIIIDGNGADEILGGYQHHVNAHNKNYLNYNHLPIQGLKISFQKDLLEKKYFELISKFKIKKTFNDPLKDSMFNDLMGSKLRRTLLQQDHNSMSNSVEIRFPYLNTELVNFCYGLPNKFLVKNNLGKFILRDLYKLDLLKLKKRAHQTPQIKWLNKFVIDKLINELKNDKNFFDYKIFNKKKLILRLQSWKNSKKDNSVFPWQTLMIYTFIKKNFN